MKTQDTQFWQQWLRAELKAGRQVQLKARGWSMFPALRPGMQLTIAAVSVETLKVHDIIAFAANGRFVTHRLKTLQQQYGVWSFQTQGDSCLAPDPSFSEIEYLGKVLSVNGSDVQTNLEPQEPIAYKRNYIFKTLVIWLSFPYRLCLRTFKRFRFKVQ